MGAAWALLCSESGSRGRVQRGVSLLCCCRTGQGGSWDCGRVVPTACPFSCFRALSWIVSRMSPDTSGGWLCRGDIPERQRGWGCAWSCASLRRCPAGSTPRSISKGFLGVPWGLQLMSPCHAAADVPLSGCCAALMLSQILCVESLSDMFG